MESKTDRLRDGDNIADNLFDDPWHCGDLKKTSTCTSAQKCATVKNYLAKKPSLFQMISDNNNGLCNICASKQCM